MLSVKTRSIIPADSYTSVPNIKCANFGYENYVFKETADASIVNSATLTSSNVPINVKDGSYTPDADDALWSIALGFKFNEENILYLEYSYTQSSPGEFYSPLFSILKNDPIMNASIRFDSLGLGRCITYIDVEFYDSSSTQHSATFYLSHYWPFVQTYYNVYDSDSIIPLLVQNWLDIVITKSANSISLYINGELFATKNFTWANNGLSRDQYADTSYKYYFYIGKREEYGSGLDDIFFSSSLLMDNFVLFRRHTLTAAEVLELYNIKRNSSGNIAGHSQQAKIWSWYQMGDHASDNFTPNQSNGCFDAKNTTTSPVKHLDINEYGYNYIVEEGQMP